MIKNKTFLSVTIASIAVLASTAAALATPVAATRGVNVRSGPGTDFAILDTLRGGEFADAVECVQSGWCRVEHDGPSGWVYNTYLGPRPGAQGNQGANPINPVHPAPPKNAQIGACFYTEQSHQGDEYCSGPQTYNTLGGFNDRIRSYKVFGGAHVNFCVEENMAGACYEGSRSTPTLGAPLDRQASSLSVFSVGTNNNGGGFNPPAQQPPAAPNPQPPANNPPANNSNESDCSFAIVLGPDGPTASLTCGDNATLPPVANGNNNQGNGQNQGNDAPFVEPEGANENDNNGQNGQLIEPPLAPPQAPEPEPEPDRGNLACFYEQENYQGTEFCGEPGFVAAELQAYNNRFRSVKLWGNARAKLCQNEWLEGVCELIHSSKPILSGRLAGQGSSLRIYTGNPVPTVTARNTVTLDSNQYANVDASNAGVISSNINASSDFIYTEISGVESVFFAVNGAKVAWGYGPEVGYEGCLAAVYLGPSVSFRPQINQHFCIKTNMGRISELRVEGYPSNRLTFSYQTWGR